MPTPAAAYCIPRTDSFSLRAAGARHAYRIIVAEPAEPPPAQGYPVIYLLEAASSFGMLVEAIRMRSRRPDATGVGPAVVVGLIPEAPDAAAAGYDPRIYDYTAGPSVEDRASAAAPGRATGGAVRFLEFIEQDLKPAIARRLPIDAREQALVGHSLAGYFTLWTLLTQRSSFTSFVCVSPSIWWDPESLHAALPPADAADPAPRVRRVMLTIGEFEQRRAPWQPDAAYTDDALQRRQRRGMVDRAREMAATLAARQDLILDYKYFDGEDHASVVILSIARALRFVLPPASHLPRPSDPR